MDNVASVCLVLPDIVSVFYPAYSVLCLGLLLIEVGYRKIGSYITILTAM